MSENNIQNCCRICLNIEPDHVSILENETVHLHIKSCLGFSISASDDLPKIICMSCVSQLSDFYNFLLNARYSQDWLESASQEKPKKSEPKTVHPLPESEYNSDSLLEFLNNTANIEEYLNNLGKEDIPAIVNMLDKNHENSMDGVNKIALNTKCMKLPSPKKKEIASKGKNCKVNMEIDVLDSEIEIVKEILMKESVPKRLHGQDVTKTEKLSILTCFACKTKFDSIQKLSQHVSTCDNALRTCMICKTLFDSKQKMQQHSLIHNTSLPLTCNCGKQFSAKEKLIQHHKVCYVDYTSTMGCIYRCKQCNQTFKERFQLYKHAKDHIMKADERICNICGHVFIGNDALTKHRKDTHQKSEKLLYRCKICSYTSPDHKDVYVHVQKHTKQLEVTRHLCETCGKSFSTRSILLRHTAQHGNLDYKCKICQKTFYDVKTRDEHVLEHIDMAMCEKCGQNVNSIKLDTHHCV